jgi:hypothetical protein
MKTTYSKVSAIAFAGTLAIAMALTVFSSIPAADAQRNVGNEASQGAAQGARAAGGLAGIALNAAVGVQAQTGNICVNALATDTRQC